MVLRMKSMKFMGLSDVIKGGTQDVIRGKPYITIFRVPGKGKHEVKKLCSSGNT
jgi:hypothetical protein